MTAPKSKPGAKENLVRVGLIGAAKGLRGEVRIKSFTADPADIGAYGSLFDATGERSFDLRVTGMAKGQVVARIEGVGDRDAAEALKGVHLHVPRSALPATGDEEYYHADLIGLRADLSDGGQLGTIRAIYDFSAGDMLEIAQEDGGVVMVPFTRAAVPEIDFDGGRVVIDPPPGLLDDPDDGITDKDEER
jgi:16S rRNA processing protein RimM